MSLRTGILIALMLVAFHSGAAQRTQGRLTVGGGSATDITGVRSRATTIAASAVLQPAQRFTLGVGANGTRFDAGQWAASTGAALSARSSSGFVVLTVDGTADFATTSYDISYLTASVSPAMEFGSGPFVAFAGARMSSATTTTPDVATGPLPPLGRNPGVGGHSVASSGTTALAGATAAWSVSSTRVTVRYAEELGTVAAARHHERQLGAAVAYGLVRLSGAVARRERGADAGTYANGTMTVAVSSRVSLDAGAGQYPPNRLTGAAAGRFVSAGVSFRFAPSPPALPRPASVPPVAPAMTRLSIHAPDARRVEVAGDFNRWIGVAARRAPNGVWYADLQLMPGEYRYAFRIDGKEWRVPSGARTADDEFGGKSAWITVHAGSGRVGKS